MTAPAARYPHDPAPTPLDAPLYVPDESPLFDALVERPTAAPLRLAFLRDLIGRLSGGVR